MLGLFLLLLPHAAPPPVIKPLLVMAGDGVLLITLPTPRDMHWPKRDVPKNALDVRIALEQAARPRLEGNGVGLEWLARGPDGFPTLDFIGRARGPLPPRLWLRYHGQGPLMSIPHSVEVRLDGSDARKGKAALMTAFSRHSRLQRLAVDEALSGGWGYFRLARRALAEEWKSREPAPLLRKQEPPKALGLYELATGAMSLDEALALGQIKSAGHFVADRKLPLSWVSPVTIRDHPWGRMMGGKKLRPEALAGCVPYDNWYLRVSRPRALAELAETVEAWGGSPLRLAQMNDRDYRLLERYQTQLCLPVKELAKAVPAKLVRGIALTGSDLFWVEGTDVTVIVDTPDTKALLKAIDAPLGRARKMPGARRTKAEHNGVNVEGFTTQDRELSLFRAVLKERVVLSNSLPALYRVLDTISGKRKALWAAPDFRYMRTVFERDDKLEDGFVFLSDDFFRAMLSPATRIKHMRRLSSRAALLTVSHAALLYAEENGSWPAKAGALRAADLPGVIWKDSEGDYIHWDGKRGEAYSDAHGTLSRGVALIELPIKHVTPQERKAYHEFQEDYQRLWRTFIDPVGVRFHGTPGHMRVEAHMLPLSRNREYRMLQVITGGDETNRDGAKIAPGLAGAFRMNLTPIAGAEWLAFHLDDYPGLSRWAAAHLARLVYPDKKAPVPPIPPVTMVWGGEGGPALARKVADMQEGPLFLRDKQTTRRHRGVEITRVPVDAAAYGRFIERMNDLGARGGFYATYRIIPLLFPRDVAPKAFYTARIGDGWYTGLSEKALVSRIDAWKKGGKDEGGPAVVSLFFSARRPNTAAAINMLLEMQTRQKAHAANVMWQALFDGGVITPRMSEARRERVALRLWGFVPAAPDGSRAVWDRDTHQVRNERHGTWRRPATHQALDPKSKLARFIRRFESLQADLRFREDGIHTIITFAYVK